ncbi:MAG TPA: hypothetical protein VJ932_05830, partial [Alkalispirochaeta sp.]|nr:hypothetical protein [Alkalispirochaeta sp.]
HLMERGIGGIWGAAGEQKRPHNDASCGNPSRQTPACSGALRREISRRSTSVAPPPATATTRTAISPER